MKKSNLWFTLFVATLMLTGIALAIEFPPQVSSDLDIQCPTVPIITSARIDGNNVIIDVSGQLEQGSAILKVDNSPISQIFETVSLRKINNKLVGNIENPLIRDNNAIIHNITLQILNTPDAQLDAQYRGTGALISFTLVDKPSMAAYYFNELAHLESYKIGDLSAEYDSYGYLAQFSINTNEYNKYYNGLYELEHEDITVRDGDISTTSYYSHGLLTTQIVVHSDGRYYSYDGQGVLRESSFPADDGSYLGYHYDQYGQQIAKVITFSNGNSEYFDNYGTLRTSMEYLDDGSAQNTYYDRDGNLINYEHYVGESVESYNATGTLILRRVYSGERFTIEKFVNGQVFRRTIERDSLGNERLVDEYENGVLIKKSINENDASYYYDASGNYIGKTVYKTQINSNVEESVVYDAQDRVKEYTVFSEQQGGVYLTYSNKNVLLRIVYRAYPFSSVYRYDATQKLWYMNDVPIDEFEPFDIRSLKLATEIVWYPNNTVCSFGPQFRDVDPKLTDLWYMFTPVDLSKDGTQTFELIGGSVYVLGQVALTVAGDSVTVTYSTVKGKYGHIYIKSEYLNFFPDLASVTTVVPEEIGEGFAFDQEISIANDLKGDTNMLMFIRNVATFRNFVTDGILLRRYYKNYPSRISLQEAMLELMD